MIVGITNSKGGIRYEYGADFNHHPGRAASGKRARLALQ
jgi:hypothetical protein